MDTYQAFVDDVKKRPISAEDVSFLKELSEMVDEPLTQGAAEIMRKNLPEAVKAGLPADVILHQTDENVLKDEAVSRAVERKIKNALFDLLLDVLREKPGLHSIDFRAIESTFNAEHSSIRSDLRRKAFDSFFNDITYLSICDEARDRRAKLGSADAIMLIDEIAEDLLGRRISNLIPRSREDFHRRVIQHLEKAED